MFWQGYFLLRSLRAYSTNTQKRACKAGQNAGEREKEIALYVLARAAATPNVPSVVAGKKGEKGKSGRENTSRSAS
jgi:hypothetical protein